MSSIPRSTVDCNSATFRPQRPSSRTKQFCTWRRPVVLLQSTVLCVKAWHHYWHLKLHPWASTTSSVGKQFSLGKDEQSRSQSVQPMRGYAKRKRKEHTFSVEYSKRKGGQVHMHRTHVQYTCTVQMYSTNVQNTCTEHMYRTHVQYTCTVHIYSKHVQYTCTVQMYRTHVQNTCTVHIYSTHIQYTYTV